MTPTVTEPCASGVRKFISTANQVPGTRLLTVLLNTAGFPYVLASQNGKLVILS